MTAELSGTENSVNITVIVLIYEIKIPSHFLI